jgi:hypothetical protein
MADERSIVIIGAVSVFEPDLGPEERSRLDQSARLLREAIDSVS